MATSRGLNRFSKRMDELSGRVEGMADQALRKAALVADQVAVTMTPVKTGRARANWIVSINSLQPADNDPKLSGSEGSASRGAANAQTAIDQAQNVLGVSLQFGGGGGRNKAGRFVSNAPVIFLSNTLPYIEKLDNGSSAQATNGMTRAAIDAAIAQIKRERFLD